MVDVLNLEWTSFPSRDRESSTLICNYLRHCGMSVFEGPVHNGFFLIQKYKPSVIYMSNIIGAKINFEVALWCKSNKIPLISGIAEGNMRDYAQAHMIWGHNLYHEPIEDKWFLWTKRTQKLVHTLVTAYRNNTSVTGYAGADRYVFCPREKQWLADITDYDLVVGVGCWSFGSFHKDSLRHDVATKRYSSKEIDRFLSDREKFDSALNKIIRSLPKVLFILKEHPGRDMGLWGSAIEKSQNEPNVRVYKNERSIFECLSVSDIWISYESTTAMEAWLMGIPTGLLNPSGVDFPGRHNIWKGQPNFATADEWFEAIRFFQNNGELPGFAEKKPERDKIIEDTIQWADGLNHVRAGNEIIKFLEKGIPAEPLPKGVTSKTNIQALKHTLRYYIKGSPTKWSQKEVESFAQKRMAQQVDFYNRINVELNKVAGL
jgi:hypothetical protein